MDFLRASVWGSVNGPNGMDFFEVELKLRKYCVLDLKTRQKVTLFGAFPGRVGG